MKKRIQQFVLQVASWMPGWIFLLSGALTISACLVMPQVQAYRTIRWNQQVLNAQALMLKRQSQTYQTFSRELDFNNPILLRRLAIRELHLQPLDTLPLFNEQPLPPVGFFTHTQHADGGFFAPTQAITMRDSLPTALLAPERFVNPLNLVSPRLPNSTFRRLTLGRLRWEVMLLGLIGIILGLICTPVPAGGRKKSHPPSSHVETGGTRSTA